MAHLNVSPCAQPNHVDAVLESASRTPSRTRAEKCSQKSGEGSGISAAAARS